MQKQTDHVHSLAFEEQQQQLKEVRMVCCREAWQHAHGRGVFRAVESEEVVH
jgi:hypothetical protein